MGLGARNRGPRQGSASGASETRPGSRSPKPGRRAWAWGSQRQSVRADARRPGPPPPPGASPAHLSRERRHEPEPRSSSKRAAASAIAAILGLRPPLLSSLPTPPQTPRPYGAGPRRSGARFRCRGRKPRREAGSGGRAAGDGAGGLGPRPGRSRGHGPAAAGLGRAGAAGPAAMAGYARRPGVPPLSRARSLVIPDGERPGGTAGPSTPGPGAAPDPPRRAPGEAAAQSARTIAFVVIAAPAFYERRSCLPQLDCERPRGRDLDSHFFGIRPTFMCYVPSPVLAPVGDTGERPVSGTPSRRHVSISCALHPAMGLSAACAGPWEPTGAERPPAS